MKLTPNKSSSLTNLLEPASKLTSASSLILFALIVVFSGKEFLE